MNNIFFSFAVLITFSYNVHNYCHKLYGQQIYKLEITVSCVLGEIQRGDFCCFRPNPTISTTVLMIRNLVVPIMNALPT